jgi:anti-sigma regulatory factor (Ser/Thr protein kinase)
MSQHPAIRLQLVSDPLLFGGIRELVSTIARRYGFSELDSSMVSLAVDEALCNIMRHGYDKRCDCPIWLSVWLLPAADGADPHAHKHIPDADPASNGKPKVGGIRLVLEDHARQVDSCQIKSRDLEDIRPGGLGVHIIRQVMDEVRYEKRDGGGMRLTLEKKLTPREEPPPTAGPAAGGNPGG